MESNTRRSRGWRPRLACGLLGMICALHTSAQVDPQQHEIVIEQARAGDTTAAVRRLEQMLADDPTDVRLRADLITVLVWDGRYEQAAETAADLDANTIPAYALLPWARSLRELGRFDEAADLLEPTARRAAAGREAKVLYALVSAEADNRQQAEDVIERLLAAHAGDADIHNAAAYIYRRLAQPTRALIHAHKVLAHDPGNREARQHQVFAMGDLGAASRARELAEHHPDAFTVDDAERLAGDRAAQLIRFDGIAEQPGTRAYHQRARRALDMLDARILRLPEGPARMRARYDQVLALRRSEDMARAVTAYEGLETERAKIPAYVRIAAADAYLDQRRPDQAAFLYRSALADGGGGFETRVALYYALLESEDFDAALTHIDAVAESQPPYLFIPGADPVPNWNRLQADLTAAMARAFANRLDDAQTRLEALVADAPASAQIHRQLATVYRWRGWPERALEHAELALALEPDVIDSRLIHVQALIALERFTQAADDLATLARDRPDHPRVERTHNAWRQQRGWQVRLEAEAGDSDGVNEFGARDQRLETRVDTPWLGDFWRPYLTQYYSEARFPEGEADYDRLGIGLDWRNARRHAYLEIHRNRHGEADTGFTAGYDWHAGDHWSFATRYEDFSLDVPLRARGAGLDGDKAEIAARWQAHESMSLRGSISRLAISDGNHRVAGLFGLQTRLISSAHHITRLDTDLYASRASQTGGPYFNPERDASAGLTLEHDWLTRRRYERSLTQRISAGVAAYWQDGFGTHPTGFLRYEHRWELGPRWRLGYHGGLSSRVYDGEREQRWFAGLYLEALL